MFLRSILFISTISVLLMSCGGSKDIVYIPTEDFEERILDTMQVVAPAKVGEPEDFTFPVYNASHTRTIDIVHTKLDLSFDWTKQHVIGKADIEFTAMFYPVTEFELDAQNFDILGVDLNGKTAKYKYDGQTIKVFSPVNITRRTQMKVSIDYIAKPNDGPVGGSAAITSDKGLFFINPLKTDPNKPQQIWTQGETENNSRWFPTVDKPNERCTQEIYVTVQDRFKTLSNGTMISSTKNADGTRTDYWKQDQPHAPYLFMLAIGEYAVVNDSWNGKPVDYYVEPAFEQDAAEIFNHTKEMLDFFSEKLDYPYPWDKYSQVICRDYVSGAMENTTAVIFGEFVQKDHRELIDNGNDLIVAHELFHHWFGDLVTCESWANLTMNEGFANYSEYMWFQHKYGQMRADMHRRKELNSYVASFENQGGHPLIHYGYQDKEDMFDAHSYNKGGLVLHMLRDYVGDEAFYASLSKYLKDNEYSEVEADELRLAFEDITGQDLNWFFDQWYFSAGHAQLSVAYDFDNENNLIEIDVKQIQNTNEHLPVYILNPTVQAWDEVGNKYEIPVVLNQREQVITLSPSEIGMSTMPALVILDGKDILLAEIFEDRSIDDYILMAKYETAYVYKMQALKALKANQSAQNILKDHLNHDFYNLRYHALQSIDINDTMSKDLVDMVENDKHSKVRASALKKLSKLDASSHIDLAKEVITNEQAYPVIAEALSLLNKVNDPEIIKTAEAMQHVRSSSVSSQVADIFIKSKDPKYNTFFVNKIKTTSIYELFPMMNKFSRYIDYLGPKELLSSAQQLSSISMDSGEISYKKYMVTNAINNIKTKLDSIPRDSEDTKDALNGYSSQVKQILENIIASETDEELKARYSGF